MNTCIKDQYFVEEEPPLTIGNPPVLNPAWIEWCIGCFNCTRGEAIQRGELRMGKKKPKRKWKP